MFHERLLWRRGIAELEVRTKIRQRAVISLASDELFLQDQDLRSIPEQHQ